MVDLVDAMIWWDKWQLRVLVVGSLILQWFLLLAAPMRKYVIPRGVPGNPGALCKSINRP